MSDSLAALLLGGLVVVAVALASRSATLADIAEQGLNRDVSDANNPAGAGMASEWADRVDEISDAVDDAVRNEERFVGVPVSPYQ